MKIPETNPYLEFVQRHYPGIYQVTWFHNAMSYYLEKWVHGEIPFLIMEAPPQYGKTELGGVMAIPYIFSEYPQARIAYTTYGSELSIDKSEQAKKIMRSEAYKSENNDLTVPLSQRNLSKWSNTLDGQTVWVGRDGPIDGKGFDYLICDDLFKNDMEALSPIIQESAWRWYTKIAIPRLSPTGRVLLFFKRWHTNDVIGKVKTQMQTNPDLARPYTQIRFPALMTPKAFENKHPADPRQIGEPLWEWKHTARQLMTVRLEMGEADFNAVYQQDPINEEGTKIKPKWFKKISREDLPSEIRKAKFFRLGELTRNTIDKNNSACTLALDPDGKKFIIDLQYFEDDWPTCLSKIKNTGSEANPLQTGFNKIGSSKKLDLVSQVKKCRTKHNKLKGYTLPDPIVWTEDAEQSNIFIVENEQTSNFLEACRNYTGSGRDRREADIQALAGAWTMMNTGRSIVQLMAAKRKRTKKTA